MSPSHPQGRKIESAYVVGFPIHYAQHLTLVGAAVVAGVGKGALDLANMIATVTFQLPHSRETEADRIGLELMAQTAYEPRAAGEVRRKMLKVASGGTPEFLSTHPSGKSRIADLKALLPRVCCEFQLLCGNRQMKHSVAMARPLVRRNRCTWSRFFHSVTVRRFSA